jgi:hypothetical protein
MQNVKTVPPIINQDMVEIEPIHLNDSTTSHLIENNLKRELKDITSASIKNDLTIEIKKEAIANPEENKSVSKKHSKKTLRPKQIQFYFTPNVSYRTLRLNEKMMNESVVLKNMINQSPSAGIEMGLMTKASIFKNLNATGGVQLDFNRYALIAYDNGHPFATSISLLEPNNNQFYKVFKSTDYSSLTGNKRIHLHNQNLQFSLPIALEYRLLKQRNFSWHISSSIQPTILLYSQQYLLS